jgi:protoporphyrinogen oxidase
MSESWGVVGGGMLGMTLALRLAQAGKKVTLFEASDRLGGLADAWQVGPVTWDRHYHVTLLSDLKLRGILAEIGLEDALVWNTTKSEFYDEGRFIPMNGSVDFLKFPPLGLIDKFRLALTIIIASRIEDGAKLEKISLEQWLVKLSGRNTYQRIWLPLLRAKLGENHKKASAAFIWAIVRRLYAARRSGLKTEKFGYVSGGYARVVKAFEAKLLAAGVEIRKSDPVQEISEKDHEITIATKLTERRFQRVVVASASPLAARLCTGLSDASRALHEGILYQGIVCASVVLKKPLNGAYITYITDPDVPFTAVIEMSALVDRKEFAGRTVVYLPYYATADDPAFAESDENIRERFLGKLLAMYPQITESDVEGFAVSRVKQVLAVTTMNYSAGLPSINTNVPGLSILNSAHIINGTLNVNETIGVVDDNLETLLNASWRTP